MKTTPVLTGIAAILLLLHSGGARAEAVRLRSGEHGTFTRLVADLPPDARWRFGRTETGYRLQVTGDAPAFDTRRVFRQIGRDRIAAVSAAPGTGAVDLTVSCTCHATATSPASGSVVIDVAPGPAPSGSPFEQRLAEAGPASPRSPVGAAPLEVRPEMTPGRVPPPHLPLFWGDAASLPPPDGSALPPAPHHPTAEEEAPLHPPASPPTPSPAPASGVAAGLSAAALPSPRVQEAQDELIHQLGRAASQGLIDIALPERPVPADSRPGDANAPVADAPLPAVAIRSETSIDRDALDDAQADRLSADGIACLPDTAFDLASWGDGRPPTIQLSERRGALVGEFDRPSPEAVIALARLYLFLGFGAEARNTLATFAATGGEAARLADLGTILDGENLPSDTPLAGMASCDTSASLWALLARPATPDPHMLNERAVVRAFSALPPHLRRHLGPTVVSRLVAAGAVEGARAVRDAMLRDPDRTGPATDLATGQLDLATGRAQEGEARLFSLAAGNGPEATEALILALRSQLDRGVLPDLAHVEAAEALAFEHRQDDDAPELGRLAILARAARGDFDGAFATLRRWRPGIPDAIVRATARGIFSRLATEPDSTLAIRGLLSNQDLLEASGADVLLRLNLADRLTEAWLTAEAREILAGEAAFTDRGRILLARADLLDGRPEAALSGLAGLTSPEAARVRAEALSTTGDHLRAAAEFRRIGEGDRAGLEAWRAGDPAAAAWAPEAAKEMLGSFAGDDTGTTTTAPAAGPAGQEPAPGPLAKARALLASSRASRTAIDRFLTAAGG